MAEVHNTGAGNRPHSDQRRRQLAAIHCARRDLFGDDEDSYRDAVWACCRARSAADLDEPGRLRLIEHFQKLGWRAGRKGRSTPAEGKAGLVGKIRAMLAQAKRPDAYADGMSKKMFKVERFEWLNEDQLRRLVAALNYDAKRREAKA